jgi:PAS domain S-box-containing protein
MESELGLIMDGLPALVWTATPEGRIDFANRRWLKYTGPDPAEAGGLDRQDAICREDLPQSLERWRAILTSGEPGEVEAPLRRFDTRCRRFVIGCSPARDKAGRILKWSFVGTDIEDLRRSQKGPEEAGKAHEVNQPLSGIITNANTCLHMLATNPLNVEGARETARRTIRDGHRRRFFIFCSDRGQRRDKRRAAVPS